MSAINGLPNNPTTHKKFIDLDEVKKTKFPAGEMHVTHQQQNLDPLWIKACLRSNDDIFSLLNLHDILRRNLAHYSLYMPYVPYGRQDRATTDDSAFSLRVFADIINSQNFREVVVYEPHSDVTPALIKNCRVKTSDFEAGLFARHVFNTTGGEKVLVVAPDVGAVKRCERFLAYCRECGLEGVVDTTEIGIAFKKRDPATGRLQLKSVTSNIDGRSVLMYDDCGDGFGTHLMLADNIESRVKTLSIFVAHAMFSKGVDVVDEKFDNIGTTNSFYQGKDNRVKVYPI